jgi:hypothetical protein
VNNDPAKQGSLIESVPVIAHKKRDIFLQLTKKNLN